MTVLRHRYPKGQAMTSQQDRQPHLCQYCAPPTGERYRSRSARADTREVRRVTISGSIWAATWGSSGATSGTTAELPEPSRKSMTTATLSTLRRSSADSSGASGSLCAALWNTKHNLPHVGDTLALCAGSTCHAQLHLGYPLLSP